MTKEIKLTRGMVALVDDEDFEWLNQWNWYATRSYGDVFYAKRNVTISANKQESVLMHAIIAKTPKGMYTDHIDRNGLNNQRNNLRVCTASQNMQNRAAFGSLGVKGVTKLRSGKYKSQIRHNGKRIYLGVFEYIEDAEAAYREKEIELFGEYAVRYNS